MSFKKIFNALILAISLLSYSQLTFASDSTKIQQSINHILKNFGQDINIGIVVQSMDNGKILYQHNPNLAFNTASSMKLFTAITALNYLGPNFTFSTQLATDSLPINNSLAGNLYIKFTGDPELTTEELNGLINILSQRGINTIQGNLIIDDTTLDHENWGPGWMWDEKPICYAAPAIAVIVNHNCFDANIIPSKQLNATPQIHVTPTLSSATISNQAITKTAEKWACPLNLRITGDNRYRLTGCIPPGDSPLPLQIAFNNPPVAAANILLALLKQHGIALTGNVVNGTTPVNATIIAIHKSPPLSEIITQMLKKSDNLIADVLFKTLGAKYFHTTGTWSNGAAAIRAILGAKTGINFEKLVIVDGAGLSRYNLVTPMQFIKLINYAYHGLPDYSVLYQGLPIMGVDGTLDERLKNTSYAGKIHAKTGTMASTSSLVGYLQTNNNQTLAFAILINGFVEKPETYQAIEDQICKALIL